MDGLNLPQPGRDCLDVSERIVGGCVRLYKLSDNIELNPCSGILHQWS